MNRYPSSGRPELVEEPQGVGRSQNVHVKALLMAQLLGNSHRAAPAFGQDERLRIRLDKPRDVVRTELVSLLNAPTGAIWSNLKVDAGPGKGAAGRQTEDREAETSGTVRSDPRDGKGHNRQAEQDPSPSLRVPPAFCFMPWFSGAGQTQRPFSAERDRSRRPLQSLATPRMPVMEATAHSSHSAAGGAGGADVCPAAVPSNAIRGSFTSTSSCSSKTLR